MNRTLKKGLFRIFAVKFLLGLGKILGEPPLLPPHSFLTQEKNLQELRIEKERLDLYFLFLLIIEMIFQNVMCGHRLHANSFSVFQKPFLASAWNSFCEICFNEKDVRQA